MSKQYLLVLPVLLAFLLGSSCTTSECSGAYPLYIGLTGYEADTLTPLILSRCGGGSFDNVLSRDTIYVTNNRTYGRIQTDTGYYYPSSGFNVYAPFVWQIDVPSTGKRDRISGITNTDGKLKQEWNPFGMAESCFDVCTGYYLNGVYQSTGKTTYSIGRPDYAYMTVSK